MKTRNVLFDLLRIFATFAMVLHHFQQYTGQTGFWFRGFFWFGILVEFFFILSGVLCYHHVNEIYKGDDMFLVRKYIRLFPMAALALAMQMIGATVYYLIFHIPIFGREAYMPLNYICESIGILSWIHNGGISISWYSSVLLLCYILLFLIVKISKRIRSNPIWFYVPIIVFGLWIRMHDSIDIPFVNINLARGYSCFFWAFCLPTF